MKSLRTILLVLVLLMSAGIIQAQSLKVLVGNTLMGTGNGLLLGAGAMAFNDNPSTDPLRFGVGLGTLYGLGMGVYDLSYSELGAGYRIEGMFNSAGHSAFIVLLDTFYGGVTGSVVGMAVTLMADKPIVDGLRYGFGVGTFAGFAFGLVDVFIFSDPIPAFVQHQAPGGFIHITNGSVASLDLFQPAIYSLPAIQNGNVLNSFQMGLDIAKVSIRF